MNVITLNIKDIIVFIVTREGDAHELREYVNEIFRDVQYIGSEQGQTLPGKNRHFERIRENKDSNETKQILYIDDDERNYTGLSPEL